MNPQHRSLDEVIAASAAWIERFNAGDAQACVDAYLPDAVMNAAPFGRFVGTDAIAGFWKPFVASGAGELVYTDVALRAEGADRVRLSATWRMNVGGGVITNELWVRGGYGRWRLAEDDFEVQERTP